MAAETVQYNQRILRRHGQNRVQHGQQVGILQLPSYGID